jgi:hypothetical protein
LSFPTWYATIRSVSKYRKNRKVTPATRGITRMGDLTPRVQYSTRYSATLKTSRFCVAACAPSPRHALTLTCNCRDCDTGGCSEEFFRRHASTAASSRRRSVPRQFRHNLSCRPVVDSPLPGRTPCARAEVRQYSSAAYRLRVSPGTTSLKPLRARHAPEFCFPGTPGPISQVRRSRKTP